MRIKHSVAARWLAATALARFQGQALTDGARVVDNSNCAIPHYTCHIHSVIVHNMHNMHCIFT